MRKYAGLGLIFIGLIMLFKMVRVSSFGFYKIGFVDTTAIILVLFILSGIAIVVQRNKITISCMIISLVLMVVSLILGTHLHFVYTSLLDILLVFIPVIVGTGLLIREFVASIEKR